MVYIYVYLHNTGCNGVFMCIYIITGCSAIVATLVHDGFMNPVDGEFYCCYSYMYPLRTYSD